MNITRPTMARLRVLAIAVASGRAGYAFFHGKQLVDWKMSKKAVRSVADARAYARRLIALFEPDVVVTEKIAKYSRKGETSRLITSAIARVAEKAKPLDVQVPRIQKFANKYDEAHAYAKRFPELKSRVPNRPSIWEAEPFRMIYFEAIALALYIVDSGAWVEIK